MTKSETRRQYLKLTARLYEIASEFDETVLRDLAYASEGSVNPHVRRAAQGLVRLISEPKSREFREESLPRKTSTSSSDGDSLVEFFQSRDLFSSTSDIAASLPFKFSAREKESRDRYVKRLTTHLNSLATEDRRQVVEAVQRAISSRMGSGFVSNWSKLIRGL
jgi:hypothetical protein